MCVYKYKIQFEKNVYLYYYEFFYQIHGDEITSHPDSNINLNQRETGVINFKKFVRKEPRHIFTYSKEERKNESPEIKQISTDINEIPQMEKKCINVITYFKIIIY